MNNAVIILMTLLGSCCGLSAMETKTKKSKTEIDGDLRPVTALIAQLEADIPTEVGNELGQYIIAKSGVVPFISPKIALPLTLLEDMPQEGFSTELRKKDMVVLRYGGSVKILSGKTGNLIQTLPEASTEECEQRLPEGCQLISAQGEYKEAKLSLAGDKMVTVSTFHTHVSRDPELREMWAGSHGSVFAKLWCLRTGNCLYTLTGHTHDVNSVQFERAGSKVITASDDRTAKLWNAETGDCLQTFAGHEDAVLDARFNREGDKVATACSDGTAKVWDVETAQCLATFEHAETVHTVKFSNKHGILVTVTTDDRVTIWSMERPEAYRARFSLPSETKVMISLSTDGDTLLAYGDGERNGRVSTALLYSLATHVSYFLNNENEKIWFAAFNEAGDKLITAGEYGTVKIWLVAEGMCIRTFECQEEGVDFVAFDHTDERIATHCDSANSIKVWSLSTGNCLHEMAGKLTKHHGSPFTLQPDALIAWDWSLPAIRLWDLSYFQRMCKCLTLKQGYLLKALYEVAFLRKLIENRLNKGVAVLDNDGNPVTSAPDIVLDFEKNTGLAEAFASLDEPIKKVLTAYMVRNKLEPQPES